MWEETRCYIRRNLAIKIKSKKNKTPKSKAQTAIDAFKDLTVLERNEFEYRLKGNSFNEDTAKWLQEETSYFDKITLRRLKDLVSMYNKNVLKPRLIEEIDSRDIYNELLVLKGKIDSLKEFSVVVVQQKERLNRALEIERNLSLGDKGGLTKDGKSMSSIARSEIKLMGDLLEKLANIQMKTGVLKVAPKYISGEMVADDNDPLRITFKLREDFIDNLDAIEAELLDVPYANVIEDKTED